MANLAQILRKGQNDQELNKEGIVLIADILDSVTRLPVYTEYRILTLFPENGRFRHPIWPQLRAAEHITKATVAKKRAQEALWILADIS